MEGAKKRKISSLISSINAVLLQQYRVYAIFGIDITLNDFVVTSENKGSMFFLFLESCKLKIFVFIISYISVYLRMQNIRFFFLLSYTIRKYLNNEILTLLNFIENFRFLHPWSLNPFHKRWPRSLYVRMYKHYNCINAIFLSNIYEIWI